MSDPFPFPSDLVESDEAQGVSSHDLYQRWRPEIPLNRSKWIEMSAT